MVLESVESQGVRTVPLSKYLNDYDSEGTPYNGGVIIARHAEFEKKATEAKLKKFGQFAVSLFGYPYDKDEIVKIALRITGPMLGLGSKERKALDSDREFICSEYVYNCYKNMAISVEHDRRGFIAPADFARNKHVSLVGVLKR